MKTRSIIIILLLISLLGTAGYFGWHYYKSLYRFPMQPITFTTSDGVVIAGTYITPPTQKGVVLLLHMMPATKESWETLQQSLAKKDLASLAIDLRGHGQSTKGPADVILDYNTFEDVDHQLTRNDVAGAIDYLVAQGFQKNHIVIVGASIGANLAIEELSQDGEINSAVLLSPGLDFHGIESEQYARSLQDNQALYTIASKDDQYSYDSSRKLYEAATIKKDIGEFDGIGHGTAMLENKPDLVNTIADWIAARFE